MHDIDLPYLNVHTTKPDILQKCGESQTISVLHGESFKLTNQTPNQTGGTSINFLADFKPNYLACLPFKHLALPFLHKSKR